MVKIYFCDKKIQITFVTFHYFSSHQSSQSCISPLKIITTNFHITLCDYPFIFISFKKKKCSRVLRWTVSQTPQNSDVIPEAAVIIITHTTAETHCIIVFNGVLTSFCIPELMMFTFFIHMNFYCANGSVWPLFLCFWQICAELEVMGRCFRCIVMFKLREWRLFVIRPIRIDVLYELYAWSASKTQIVIHFLGVRFVFCFFRMFVWA